MIGVIQWVKVENMQENLHKNSFIRRIKEALKIDENGSLNKEKPLKQGFNMIVVLKNTTKFIMQEVELHHSLSKVNTALTSPPTMIMTLIRKSQITNIIKPARDPYK